MKNGHLTWPWDPDKESPSVLRDELQRVALALAGNGRRERATSVVFSSPHPGHGTSTVALGVARELRCLFGMRPLLIELNRLRPCLEKRFFLDPGRSMFTIHKQGAGVRDCIQQDSTGLAMLPAGGDWPATAVSRLTCRTLQEVEGRYDIVLFDAPPLLESADVMAAGSAVKELVLIVKSGATSVDTVTRVKRQTESGGFGIAGLVVTMQKPVLPRWLDRMLPQ